MDSAAIAAQDGRGGHRVDLVHAWRVGRLTSLGVSAVVAEAVAAYVDWHEVAKLVQRGCPAPLALAIIA